MKMTQNEDKKRSKKQGDGIPWNDYAKENYVKLIEALLRLVSKQKEWEDIKDSDVPVLVRWGEESNELEVTGKENGKRKGTTLVHLANLVKTECNYELRYDPVRSKTLKTPQVLVQESIYNLSALELYTPIKIQKNGGYRHFIISLKEGSQSLEIPEDKEDLMWFEETRKWLEQKWDGRRNEQSSQNDSEKSERKNFSIYWRELNALQTFCGRQEELNTIKKWIRNGCRLIAIQGMGGNGKTTLAQQLAQDLESQFDRILYCSLSRGLTLREILDDFMQNVHDETSTNIPPDESNTQNMIHRFVYDCLRPHRYCLILDEVESIAECSESEKDYNDFLKIVGETSHEKSCIILIGRKMPQRKIIDDLKGRNNLELMVLKGLDRASVIKFCRSCGLHGTENELERLSTVYGGNPMKIRLASNVIKSTYGGSITHFLTDGTKNFDSINHLIEPQLDSLSDIQREILIRLAKEQSPMSLKELRTDFPSGLTSNLDALINYGFIETVTCNEDGALYTIIPIMRIYILNLRR